MFPGFCYYRFHLDTAFWTKPMVFAQLGMAKGAEEVRPDFEVFDTDEAFIEVSIFNCNSEGFGDTASQVKQDPDK